MAIDPIQMFREFGANPRLFPQVLNEMQLFSIGQVVLHGWEVPEVLHSVGQQQVVVHNFIGGGRTVQALGEQPGPIRWRGKLVPQVRYRNEETKETYEVELDPLARALDLDAIRRTGDSVDFIYGPLQWLVVVEDFKFDIKNRNEIDYYISLVVIGGVDATLEVRDESLTLQAELTKISVGLEGIFQLLLDSEIYLVLGLNVQAAINSGNWAQIGLAGLIAGNAIRPDLGLISKANQLLHSAMLLRAAIGLLVTGMSNADEIVVEMAP